MTKHKASLAAMFALVVMLLTAGALQAQGSRSVFGWVVANRVTVQSGGLAVTGHTALDTLTYTAPTVATVTNNMTLTPGGSYQSLTAAGTVSFGAITAAEAGTVLTLVNTANQTITISDTGTLKLAGNIALGQYDALNLISDGTNWIQTAPVGNN